jgi:hypothetical protein
MLVLTLGTACNGQLLQPTLFFKNSLNGSTALLKALLRTCQHWCYLCGEQYEGTSEVVAACTSWPTQSALAFLLQCCMLRNLCPKAHF